MLHAQNLGIISLLCLNCIHCCEIYIKLLLFLALQAEKEEQAAKEVAAPPVKTETDYSALANTDWTTEAPAAAPSAENWDGDAPAAAAAAPVAAPGVAAPVDPAAFAASAPQDWAAVSSVITGCFTFLSSGIGI